MTVYGTVQGTISDSGPLYPGLGAYAAARIAAERMAESYPRVVTLRPGCEYGPECDAWSTRVAQWLIARRLGDLGAAGDGYCNLLFIDDLVTAIMAAIQQPDIDGQAFNLSTPEVVTWNDYFMRFAKALGATPVRRVTSRRLRCETKLIAPPLKILELTIGAQRAKRWGIPAAIPPSILALCSQEIKLDVRKAQQLLGIRFTPVDTGLAATAAWINHPH
jgi:nucleoside-diphosphate-sugar epimerase